MSQTQVNDADSVIKEMLTENTGSHFLDSGGAYGRHWEDNQENPPWDKPRIDVNRDYVVKNVYHFLTEEAGLSRDSEVERLEQDFFDYADRPENEDVPWRPLMNEFAEDLHDMSLMENLYEFNTYNFDSSLSQVLQGVVFSVGGTGYCLLQIHQGCDVRGGYTKPRLFSTYEPHAVTPMELELWCGNCDDFWYESCLYDHDNPPVYNEEDNRVECPDCDGEVLVH